VASGQHLFQTGDPDEFVHVVEAGYMEVYIREADGRATRIKLIKEGETISSLLSFLDCMTGEDKNVLLCHS